MRAISLRSILAASFLLLIPPQVGQQEARLSLMSKDYKTAIRLLGEERAALTEEQGGQDRSSFLIANARFLSGDTRGAAAEFESLIKSWPKSAYVHLARYGLARCKAKGQDFQAAAELFRKEIERLLSPKRREALASVYLTQANKALKKDRPQFKAAISFFDLAIGLQLPQERERELRFEAGKLAFEAKNYGEAAKRFQALVTQKRGVVFGKGNGAPAFEERYWLARSWRKTGRSVQARRLLEDCLREGIPGDLQALARFELAHAYGVPTGGDLKRGAAVLREFLSKHPSHEKAPEACYLLSKTQARLGQFEAAIATIARLEKDYGDQESSFVPEAVADRASYLRLLNRFDDSIEAWRDYLARYPAHRRWMDAQRAIVDLDYARAEHLRSQGDKSYPEAIKRFQSFLDAHPLDRRCPRIHLRIAEMLGKLKKHEEQRSYLQRCARKYSGTNEASEALYHIGYLLETTLFNYKDALDAYEKVKGAWRGRALARLNTLRAKSMTLETERVFHTAEKARVRLRSRNIEAVRVRAYRLDMENFFQGTLGRGSVESLAVEVISPDKTFESKVKGYVPHKETEREIPLPFQVPGAYVVKVDGGNLEATTLVLVSDLAVVTKSSRDELFVFAQDTRQMRPFSGARIVVTDGTRILGEGKTDERGSWRFRDKILQKKNSFYVLASSSTGSIATTLNLSGLGRSVGLRPRNFLYIDRNVYRPGDQVHARAVLRSVEKGVYIVPKKKAYALAIYDSSQRMLASKDVELSGFGTVHADFHLPEDAALGSFSVRLLDREDRRTLESRSFSVYEYQAPRVSMSIESAQKVLLRGEKIEGRVKARYFFGGPVVGKKVQISTNIDGPRILTGVTDKAGEFHFSFETTALRTGARVAVQASIAEEQAYARAEYQIRRTGYKLSVSLPTSVYVAGDDLEAKVETKSHDDKPVQRSLTAALFRLVTERGTVREIPAGKVEIESSAKKGQAFARFHLKDGGQYRIRVYGMDRFHARIDARRDFFVSGKEDKVKLRVLSRIQHAKVGDLVTLRILNRAGPKLCLITTEGDGVLRFESKILPMGESRMELRLEELHAPNFALGLAMIDGNKLHLADKTMIVERPLVVKVVPGSERILPGGKIALEIEAKDSLGKGVVAEFSVAAVEKSLIERWGENGGDLHQIFYGPSIRRSTQRRTTSSCTFRYRARTRTVNKEIQAAELEERMRALEKSDKRDANWGVIGLGGEALNLERSKGLAYKSMKPKAARPESRYGRMFRDRLGADKRTAAVSQGAAGWSANLQDGPIPNALPGQTMQGIAGLPQVRSASREMYAVNSISGQVDGQVFFSRGGQGDIRARAENVFGQQLRMQSAQLSVTPDPQSDAQAQEELELMEELVRSATAAAAVFVPSVVTDASGRASLEIELPRKVSAWRLRLRGITESSLCGEAKTSVVTAKDLVAKTAVPRVLTEGDVVEARIGAHNLSTGDVSVDYELERDGKELKKGTMELPKGAMDERSVRLSADRVGRGRLILRTKSDKGAKDSLLSSYEVLPWGIEERAARAGRFEGEQSAALELPAGRSYRSRKLVIEVGPDVPEDLLPFGGLRGRSQLCLNRPYYLPPTISNQAAMGLAALNLLADYAGSKPGAKGRIERLRSQIAGTIAALQSAENGGRFYWMAGTKQRRTLDQRSGLIAGLFLVRAQNAGFIVDRGVLSRMHGQIQRLVRSASPATLTWCFLIRAESGKGDFARFNTLYRSRSSLDIGSLGRLALGAHAMRRSSLAKELERRIASLLGSRLPASASDDKRPGTTGMEDLLWGLHALQLGKGYKKILGLGETWLQKRRKLWGWSNAMTTALAMEFLTARRTRDAKVPAECSIVVNDDFRVTADFRTERTRQRFVVPARALKKGANRVRLTTTGKGKLVWSILLTGITEGLPKREKVAAARSSLARNYLQAPSVLDGKVLPEGFSSVGSELKRWRNEAKTLRVGEAIRVQGSWYARSQDRTRLGSVVVEEPIPAGCLVKLEEIQGSYDHVELGAGFVRFYVHRSRRSISYAFPLRGFLPGKYRILPTHAYSLDRPEFSEYGKPGELEVLPALSKKRDERRPTPDELYHHGIRVFDALTKAELQKGGARRDKAKEQLSGLFRRYGRNLRDSYYKETVRRLLRLSLFEEEHQDTVAYFEAMKSRDENHVLSYEAMTKVAMAYYRSGEFEQSLTIYRAIAETSFLKEMQIAGALDRLGEVQAPIHFMQGLFMDFPGVPTVREAMYSLAQDLNLKAAELEQSRKANPRAGSPRELRLQARRLCTEFLLRYPEDGDADEVLFTLASMALEADRLDEGIDLLHRAAKAHPNSKWFDDFLYLEGYAWFKKGEHKRALGLLRRVATEDFPLGKGRRGKSESRWLAIFLQGQIHHAAGKPVQALAEYERVKERFSEAKEAASYFQARRLEVPEVSLVLPGEASKLKLRNRNIGKFSVTVYKVDLMRLYLLRKSLNDMGNVQLFGISPIYEGTKDLSSSARYVDHKTELSLPIKEPGAYLVLVRAGELKSSGLLLRTDLEIEAQELSDSARLRVNVKRKGVFLPKADVKVVGDRDRKIRSGKTDLRGIYVADDLRGKATVLVKAGESYAFYRSHSSFGAAPQPQRGRARKKSKGKQVQKDFDALKLNFGNNRVNQNKARQQLKQLWGNSIQGVEIRRSK